MVGLWEGNYSCPLMCGCYGEMLGGNWPSRSYVLGVDLL